MDGVNVTAAYDRNETVQVPWPPRNATTAAAAAVPPTYTALEAFTIGSVLFLVIVVTIVGNVLVCIAVCLVRKLRRPCNYLLVSLAVSDLCVAILVMPMALIYLLLGRWPFGTFMCDLWVRNTRIVTPAAASRTFDDTVRVTGIPIFLSIFFTYLLPPSPFINAPITVRCPPDGIRSTDTVVWCSVSRPLDKTLIKCTFKKMEKK